MSNFERPVVAIVGRPNVGKSTLFNRIIGNRRSIVGDEPGITRDRLYESAVWEDKPFLMVDTGGIVLDDKDVIPREIIRQASAAIEEADIVMMIVDGQQGIHPLDKEIYRMVLRSEIPFFLVVNKIDHRSHDVNIMPFYELGPAEVYPVSAEHGSGIEELMDELTRDFMKIPPDQEAGDALINVAVVGRPNVGKSSLVNALLGAERVIVSHIPGTTRDAVDTFLEKNDRRYCLIDTAGIRRKGKTTERTEKISVIMARKHLERADIALLLIDPVEGVTHLDAAIAGYALESGTAIILGMNKVDLMEPGEESRKEILEQIRMKLKFLDFAPPVFFSAKTGRGLQKLFPVMEKAMDHRRLRISTGQLNKFYERMVTRHGFVSGDTMKLDIKYLTQIRTSPPTFALFVRREQGLHFSEKRFLINQIRKEFEFYANPVILKEKHRKRRKSK